MRVPHITFYLSSRHKGGHAVYHNDVKGAAPHQGVRYLEGLFAVVRLGEVKVLEVHADGLGVGGVEGMLGVDEGGEAADPLGLGDDVQGEGRLAAGLGAEDLDDTAPRDPADAERQVKGQGARRDRSDPLGLLVAHAHYGALPELPLYLRNGGVYGLALIQCTLQKATVLTIVISIGIH